MRQANIGAEEIFVAVPADRSAEPVRSFGTFTRELFELADWLQVCHVRTMAIESTGVYWIPQQAGYIDAGFLHHQLSPCSRTADHTFRQVRFTHPARVELSVKGNFHSV